MTARRGFLVTVARGGTVTYSRTWPAKEWENARDDYFLSLHQERMSLRTNHHHDRVEKMGTRALPYSVESGGVLVKIERAAA